jgi:hypothetical protein
MNNTGAEYWVERQQWQEIGSLSVHEFRQLMRECLAEQNTKPEPEAEPVAWIVETELQDGSYNRWVCMDKKRYKEHHDSPNPIIPLYTGPEPVREPMPEDKIDEELETNEYYCAKSFADGVRFAEKYHGIGESDE